MATPQPNVVKTLPLGFQAQIRGASLWDLVQIECLARKHRVVRVTTVGNVGYLYFDGGNIVHASTFQLEGEAAACEMLQRTQGSFEPCDRAWPAVPTIDISSQALLLRAAQSKDEEGSNNSWRFLPRSVVQITMGPPTMESPMSTKAPQGTQQWRQRQLARRRLRGGRAPRRMARSWPAAATQMSSRTSSPMLPVSPISSAI